MFIAILTEDNASVVAVTTAVPNSNCRPGLACIINTAHLVYKDQTRNEVLKNNRCLVCELKRSS
jgi:hypothetical protein